MQQVQFRGEKSVFDISLHLFLVMVLIFQVPLQQPTSTAQQYPIYNPPLRNYDALESQRRRAKLIFGIFTLVSVVAFIIFAVIMWNRHSAFINDR